MTAAVLTHTTVIRVPGGSNWVVDVLVQKAIGLSLKSLKSSPTG